MIEEIPVRFISNVKILDLRGNKIGVITPAISNLHSLQVLILGQNMVSKIIKPFFIIIDYCDAPSIASLPVELYSLNGLTQLVMESNKIAEVSPHITKLTSLSILNLSNNNLVTLPPEIGLMTSLHSLEIQGNLIKSIRANVMAKGTKAILEALRLRMAM